MLKSALMDHVARCFVVVRLYLVLFNMKYVYVFEIDFTINRYFLK